MTMSSKKSRGTHKTGKHMYVYHGRGDHYVCHEEIAIDKEMERVKRAAR
jgi:hypothetical protein